MRGSDHARADTGRSEHFGALEQKRLFEGEPESFDYVGSFRLVVDVVEKYGKFIAGEPRHTVSFGRIAPCSRRAYADEQSIAHEVP